MSRVRANQFTDKAGTGAPTFTKGAIITGVATATSFAGDVTGNVTGNLTGNVTGIVTGNVTGNLTGNVTGNTSGTAGGLTGNPTISVGNITAVDGTFSGNVSIAKTLTYEDVKNVDSVGLITARKGIVSSGVVTATSFDGEFKVVDESIDTLCFPLFSPDVSVSGGKASGIGSICAGSNLYFNSSTGELSATKFSGDGSSLTGVISGVEVKSGGSSVGTSITAINFQSGATVTASTASGISTITIAAGIETAAHVKTNGQTATLNLDTAQDHQVTCTGTVTITTTGGSVGESHDIRIENAGSATVGLSTNFLWPSGASPSLPTASGAISLISFTVHKVGVGTQLLSGASLNYS